MSSSLSLSLMERLSTALPAPVIVTAQNDSSEKDTSFLESKNTKQVLSLLRIYDTSHSRVDYRKQFAGSLLLSIQYRMHPSISAFSSAVFYDSQLSTPAYLKAARPFPRLSNAHGYGMDTSSSIRFLNIGGKCNERKGTLSTRRTISALSLDSGATSYSNALEAKAVVTLLIDLLKNNDKLSIGIVTPYTSQVELIKLGMTNDAEYQSLAASLPIDSIEVKSVDGYQGRERDVILFSAVRSNRNGNIGFLNDWRRMNVALTRSKNALIVVGDLECLEEGDRHWAAFGKWCRGYRCIVDVPTTSE
jgi:superfamily I DNA and/or RNA helicase